MPPYDRWYHQSIAHGHYKMWICFWGSGHSPYDARRYRSQNSTIDRMIDRRGPHDWSYDRSFMATTSRAIFPNRCWSRDHAYANRTMTYHQQKRPIAVCDPLLEIVANIADRSQDGLISTNRPIKKSYDPEWLWLKIIARMVSGWLIFSLHKL